MKKKLLLISMFAIFLLSSNAQERNSLSLCNTSGFCSNFTNQYPSTTFSTTSSTWQTVSAYMNAGNWTLFNVTSGNTYEWSYCEVYGGTSTAWDAQLTLLNNSSGTNLCFSDNVCGTTNNAPYISWVATFTGVVKILTSQASCTSNTGSPYTTLVWRMANGVATTQVLGIDVSSYQATINWTQVKNTSGKLFAWAKATEGLNVTDSQYHNNATNGVSAGVKMGAYHFAHPDNNPTNAGAVAEANHFLSVAQSYIIPCELPPALDLEVSTSLTNAQLTAWAQTWMNTVKTATGITPILYTSGSIAGMLQSSLASYCDLWIADPDNSSTAIPPSLGSWAPNWAFKQYSWTGAVSGISGNVDMDVFNGNISALNALLGCTTGIAENNITENNNFKIYPNPANDNITIENNSSDTNQDEMISIYNIQGQLLLQQLMQQHKTEINVSGFTGGLYIVTLKTENGMEVKKFIKE